MSGYYVLYTAYGCRWQAGPYEQYARAEKHVRDIKQYREVSGPVTITAQLDPSRVSVGKR